MVRFTGDKPIINIAVVGNVYSGKDMVLAHLLDTCKTAIHIATGDILRRSKQEGTLLGRIAQHFDATRSLTPDVYMNAIVANRFLSLKDGTTAVWQGYPRTVKQYETILDLFRCLHEHLQWNVTFDAIIYLEAKDEKILRERAEGRLTCRPCGRVYHERLAQPQAAGMCDKGCGPLYVRPEDRDPVQVSRAFTVYETQTAPMVEMMRARHPAAFRTIDASRPIVEIRKDVESILMEISGRDEGAA